MEDTECVYGLPHKEMPMDEKNETALKRIAKWFLKNSFYIVVTLSVLHIGLAYIHTRESGRADQFLFFPIFPFKLSLYHLTVFIC